MAKYRIWISVAELGDTEDFYDIDAIVVLTEDKYPIEKLGDEIRSAALAQLEPYRTQEKAE